MFQVSVAVNFLLIRVLRLNIVGTVHQQHFFSLSGIFLLDPLALKFNNASTASCFIPVGGWKAKQNIKSRIWQCPSFLVDVFRIYLFILTMFRADVIDASLRCSSTRLYMRYMSRVYYVLIWSVLSLQWGFFQVRLRSKPYSTFWKSSSCTGIWRLHPLRQLLLIQCAEDPFRVAGFVLP